jgi:hypothetical protein
MQPTFQRSRASHSAVRIRSRQIRPAARARHRFLFARCAKRPLGALHADSDRWPGNVRCTDGHTPAATNWPMTHRRRPPAHTSYQSFAHATTIRFCNSPTALTEAASLASSICGASVDGRS